MDTVRIRGATFPPETRGTLEIPEIPGGIDVYVVTSAAETMRLQLLPDAEQRDALFVRFYAEGDEPGVAAVQAGALLGDLFRRFLRGSSARE